MLVGFIENINSDRKIIESSSLRLDILYFLGYNIDEPLPWHSTLSRTRKLFGEEVFLEFFRDILRRCVERGMLSGKIQAIDSAYIKANASIDGMIEIDSKKYFDDITDNEEFEEKKSVKKKVSNQTHISRSDPDSRLSTKPNKPTSLNHLGIISVDTKNHIISGAAVDFADKKDMETSEFILDKTIENLQENGIEVKEVLADRGYGSWQTYKYLESKDITAYVPCINDHKPQRDDFKYNKENDCYTCKAGAVLPFKSLKQLKDRNAPSKIYRAKTEDCKNCLFYISHSVAMPRSKNCRMRIINRIMMLLLKE
jgi:biotin operon repressor